MKKEMLKVVFFITIACAVIIGIVSLMLTIGKEKAKDIKKYETTMAQLVGVKERQTNIDETTTYYQKYEYEVKGKKYQIATNYSSSIIQKVKLIKYNPENPNEAILPKSNVFSIIGLMVVFFTIIPIGLNIASKVRKRLHIIMDIFISFLFFLLGTLTYILMCFDMLEFDLVTAYNIAGIGLVIPFFWILMGGILTISIIYAIIKKKYNQEIE